jgi:hypothetical protein
VKHLIVKNGGFELVEDTNAINARLERLVMVPIDGQIGFIDEGSRLYDYFYQKNSQETVLAIINEVKTLITTYEKDLHLISVGARIYTPPNSAADKLEIIVEYEYKGVVNKTILTPTMSGGI